MGGEWDTREVVNRIAKLRAERATLLGYANHAAYQLEDQTAKDIPTVNKLLADLAPAAVANAKREGADMQTIIDQEKASFPLAPWDWDFYSEKVRKERYAFDESQLKPYFELNHVITDGVFFAAGKLYGLTFKERKDLPVYLPDVRIWECSSLILSKGGQLIGKSTFLEEGIAGGFCGHLFGILGRWRRRLRDCVGRKDDASEREEQWGDASSAKKQGKTKRGRE